MTAAPGGGAILLVEDDLSVRRVVRRILERAGYAVVEAGNGLEAMEVMEGARETEGRFDLVLTDAVMPGLGGSELVRRLRRDSPDLGALLMSGYPLDDPRHAQDDLAGSAFLQKPFGSFELLERVRDVLDARAVAASREGSLPRYSRLASSTARFISSTHPGTTRT
jgi:CheY-like chemotaxis protein